jgi:hypothetical protein
MSFCLIGASVQAFFTYRVYVVSGRRWFAVPLWTLEFANVGLVMAIVILATQSSGFLEFKEHYNGLVYVILISCALVRTYYGYHEKTWIDSSIID